MKITRQSNGSVVVLAPHGPLTTEDVPDFRREVEAALSARSTRTVIDMADVPYVDSAGLEALSSLGSSPAAAMKRLKLAALTDCARVALDITDVLPRLDVYDSVNDAIRGSRR